MHDETDAWVEVYRCPGFSRCQEFGLVLLALGIGYRLEREEGVYRLAVAPEDVSRAIVELAEYEEESREWPPPEPAVRKVVVDVRDFAGYWVVLLVCYTLERHRAFSRDWLAAGQAKAGLILRGEWWRAVTALTLHADGPHLFNNLVFGSLFGVLLGQELGRGLTWFSILLAGTAGNALNAWLHDPEHASVGASTGIFGAIGMLVMVQWRRRERSPQHLLRRWTPPIVGAVLLGYLGTAGARTDVLAHVVGMASGVVLGLFYSARPRRQPAGGVQGLLGVAALLILLAAWTFALGRPPG